MTATQRKYPIGIQTFSQMIQGGYLYADKTDLVWQLAHTAKYIFLSRPRRFGKSLLSTTLESYFLGERKLFSGLKLMPMESEWTCYPVVHLDFSTLKDKGTADGLRRALTLMLSRQEGFANNPLEVTPGEMMEGIIRRLYHDSGRQVVVIIDEYDAPLLDVLQDEGTLDGMRSVMKEFYQPLKACEEMVRFCFITGITKFSQLSIFSTLNNLLNVSMDSRFSALCGITEEELADVFKEDVQRLAEAYGEQPEQMMDRLRQHYDGYHFSENSPGVYNPYSILKAFQQRKIASYWFESGTPTFLIQQLQHFHTDITSLEHIEVLATAFDQPTESMYDALPLLYQTGYLTIKDYRRDGDIYTLSFPNSEVRTGYARGLIPAYLGLKPTDMQGFSINFWKELKNGNVEQSMRMLQSYLASLPYVEGFKKKLENVATAEGFYEYTLYLIFTSFNDLVRTQVKCQGGRIDMVMFMPDAIYVMELKVDGTAQKALDQINELGYATPFLADGRRVVKVGVNFSSKTRTVEEWIVSS